MNMIKNNALEERIGKKEIFAFGCGEVSTNILFAVTTVLLTFFYTDVIGVSAATVGLIIGVSQIFNGISDVAAGIIIDRTRSKYGKSRSWMLYMSVPYAISFVLLMTVPKVGEYAQAIYIFIAYNLLMTVVYTMLYLAFTTLYAFMTRDQGERAKLTVVRMTMSPIANIAVTMTFLKIVNSFGGDQAAWIKVTAIYALIACLLMLFSFFHTKERVDVKDDLGDNKLPVKTALKVLGQNKYFIMLAIFFIILAHYMTFRGTMLMYCCKYILGNEEMMGTINMASQVTMIIFIPLVGLLAKKIKKRDLCIGGGGIIIVGSLMVYFSPANVPLVFAGSLLQGIGASPAYALIFVMIADSNEYGHWKTGIRTPGVIQSAASCGQKFGSGAGSAIIGAIMAASGYNGLAAAQTPKANATIVGLYTFGLAFFGLAMIVVLLFYKLDSEYPAVMDELLRRESAMNAA